jgi:hypothetical protein
MRIPPMNAGVNDHELAIAAEESCAEEGHHMPDPAPVRTARSRTDAGEHQGRRRGNALYLELQVHARQKKNARKAVWVSGRYGPRQVFAPNDLYLAFAQDVKAAVLPMRRDLKLPLPPGRYLLSAEFHVPLEGQNKRADFDGYLTGTLDALQDADVFGNDREFCGSRHVDVFVVERAPLVRVWITPFPEGAHA